MPFSIRWRGQGAEGCAKREYRKGHPSGHDEVVVFVVTATCRRPRCSGIARRSTRDLEVALGGRGTPSGVRTSSIFSAALRKDGLKLRTPNCAKIDFIRLIVLIRSLSSDSRSRCGRLASSSDMCYDVAFSAGCAVNLAT